MFLLGFIIGGVITTLVSNALFYHRSKSGEMEVEWNEEDCVWNSSLHFPAGVDYSKIKKVIITVTKK